jgi:hypothetical protein
MLIVNLHPGLPNPSKPPAQFSRDEGRTEFNGKQCEK